MTTQTDIPGSVTTVYQVSGMSCGHCEGSVSGEISEIPGVTSVKAVAATGEVTVVSAAPLDEEAVRAAVDEAGFELMRQGLSHRPRTQQSLPRAFQFPVSRPSPVPPVRPAPPSTSRSSPHRAVPTS